PAGPGVREFPARGRDQPRLAEDPGGAARVHAGEPGHGRRRQLRAGSAVPGDGDAEPDRVRGHLPAARGAARPLHPPGRDRLPAAARRGADAYRANERPAARLAAPGRDRRERARPDRAGERDLRRGERQPLRGRPAWPYALRRAALPRRQPALRDRAPARREGTGASRRPRLRVARRRQGLRRARPGAPPDRRARGALGRADGRRARPRGARAHPGSGMTPRGRFALLLGCATYLGAWAFGSKPLYPVALGLLAAVLLAWLWTRLAGRPSELRRRVPEIDRFAGDDVQVRIELERERRLVPA